jgi:hypothetical protein
MRNKRAPYHLSFNLALFEKLESLIKNEVTLVLSLLPSPPMKFFILLVGTHAIPTVHLSLLEERSPWEDLGMDLSYYTQHGENNDFNLLNSTFY